jgi:hypothetical protein
MEFFVGSFHPLFLHTAKKNPSYERKKEWVGLIRKGEEILLSGEN